MIEKAPVLDVFIGRRGDAWRLVFAPLSWMPPMLGVWANGCREIFPVARPDADDLANFMWKTHSPYEHHRIADGGVEIRAEGRSAVTLLVWLDELVRAAPALAS